MKKVLFGLLMFALSLCIYAYGKPLSAQTFAEKMQPYSGRVLNADEIRQVLIGNTITREATTKNANDYNVYMYYRTAKLREVHFSVMWRDDFEAAWSTEPDLGYCYERRGGGTRCFSKVRISIEKNDVKIKFSRVNKKGKKKSVTFTLLPGKHEPLVQ